MVQNPIRSPRPDTTLAIVSLVLAAIGLIGIVPTLLFTLCAIIPIGFGLGALITGILARTRANRNPEVYGGAGLAIGGIVAGVISIAAPVAFIILALLFFIGIIGLGHLAK